MAKKRSRIDIVADMLSTIQMKGGTIKPTHLMYKANLSHNQMNSYLEDLITKNFIQKIQKKNSQYIIITDNGHNFLKKINEMKEFEETFGL